MTKRVQHRLHNAMSKPALKYLNETPILTAEDRKCLQAAHMSFLRTIYGMTLMKKKN